MERANRRAIRLPVLAAAVGIGAWFVHHGRTSPSMDPWTQDPQAKLQTIRGQIELHRVQTGGYAASVVSGRGWADLVDAGYLQRPPGNAWRGDAIGIVSGWAGVNEPSTAGPADGWYWNAEREIVFLINPDGTIRDF